MGFFKKIGRGFKKGIKRITSSALKATPAGRFTRNLFSRSKSRRSNSRSIRLTNRSRFPSRSFRVTRTTSRGMTVSKLRSRAKLAQATAARKRLEQLRALRAKKVEARKRQLADERKRVAERKRQRENSNNINKAENLVNSAVAKLPISSKLKNDFFKSRKKREEEKENKVDNAAQEFIKSDVGKFTLGTLFTTLAGWAIKKLTTN